MVLGGEGIMMNLYALYKEPNAVTKIKLVRDDTQPMKRTFTARPEGMIRPSRPRLIWSYEGNARRNWWSLAQDQGR